jgi:hypothetical protein
MKEYDTGGVDVFCVVVGFWFYFILCDIPSFVLDADAAIR